MVIEYRFDRRAHLLAGRHPASVITAVLPRDRLFAVSVTVSAYACQRPSELGSVTT